MKFEPVFCEVIGIVLVALIGILMFVLWTWCAPPERDEHDDGDGMGNWWR